MLCLNMTLDKLEKQQRFSSILVRDVLTDLIHKAKVAKAGPKSITKWHRKMSENIVRNVSRNSKHIFGCSVEKEIRKEIKRLKENIDSQLSKLRNNLEVSVESCCKPIIPDELPVSRISAEKNSTVPTLKAKREKVLEQMTNLTDRIHTLKESMNSQKLKLTELLKAARTQLHLSRVGDNSSSSSAPSPEQPSALQRTAEHLYRR